jgi:hypothetical protein
MMAEDKNIPVELNENEGKLFINNNKTEDWHGDYTGQILLPDGTRCYINLWENTARTSGNRWYKVKVGKPVKQATNSAPQAPVQNTTQANNVVELEDDIPF